MHTATQFRSVFSPSDNIREAEMGRTLRTYGDKRKCIDVLIGRSHRKRSFRIQSEKILK
jgi:hypothetical protein